MTRKQKLELTWVGKAERPRLEPRILIEDSTLSYHAAHRVAGGDRFDNLLIQGDNLLALKALEQEFAGQVKCAFIDPPYNTGSAFQHYDDGIEHSLWLTMMRDRLEALRVLLSDNGSLWMTIDDNEAHYAKVLCDEIFGRANFVANVVWEKVYTPKSNGRGLSADHDHILVYSKSPAWLETGWNVIPRNEEQRGRFTNPDNDPNGPWRTYPLDVRTEDDVRREKYRYVVETPSGRSVRPGPGRHWALPPDEFERRRQAGQIYFGTRGDAMPTTKVYLRDARPGIIARTWWTYKDVGGNQDAKREVLALFGDSGFITPKPERLLERVLTIASNPGDLVLDSFLGSGTTAAVAHKMRRRWIGIELGEHALTHCVPRLKKVVDGSDPGGVTGSTEWVGGGGFRVYRLAPSLLAKDQWGNWVISREYDAAMLAEALCKLEGFDYAPDPDVFWQHGHSTERDFLYVTTQTLSAAQLEWLSEDVGPDRSLLVLCPAWLGAATTWPNLTLKKIPNAVLGRCEFGRDDYSLQVAGLAPAPVPLGGTDVGSPVAPGVVPPRRRGRRRPEDPTQETLLDDEVTP